MQFRLLHLFSVGPPNGNLPGTGRAALILGAVVVAVVLAALVARLVRGGSALDRFAALAAALIVAMLFAPATFYWHYSTFAVPFLALAAALGASRLRGFPRRAVAVFLALCLGGLMWTIAHRDSRGYGMHDEARQFDSVVPAGSCVVTPVSSLAIANDRFSASAEDCPPLIDAFGTALALGDGNTRASLRTPALRTLWLRAYRQADFVYLVHRDTQTVPIGGAPHRYLRSHFHVVAVEGLAGTLYARNPS